MDITNEQIHKLLKVATEARKAAFAHRSKHKIGASVLTFNGRIFGGCNIESVISGLGLCGERAAIDHAIVHGHYKIFAVCTVDEHLTPTCGACLQYILLFSQVSGQEILIINGDLRGHFEVTELSILLPRGYRIKNQLSQIRSYGH